ncbi:hypothetical protein M885DRAFT_200557 [Pelagophyceae sp. CCMP2097]|nr:hypothetical protein M885DRAFT_200557 [Pelagophyceae sp. CCMP2097]
MSKWADRIQAKRAEIQQDHHELSAAKVRRTSALYGEEDEDDDETGPEKRLRGRARVIDGRLDMSDRDLSTAVVPRHINTAQLRTVHTLVIRGNRLRTLDARLIAPLVGLRWLDVSHNELERMCPVGSGTTLVQRSKIAEGVGGRRSSSPPGGDLVHFGGLPPALEVLDASHNRLARLAIGACVAPSLARLRVASNKIAFVSLDISRACNLVELDARHNLLDVAACKPLGELRSLRRLLLQANPLISDPRHRLKLAAYSGHLQHALGAAPLDNVSKPPPPREKSKPAERPASAYDDAPGSAEKPARSNVTAAAARYERARESAEAWPAVGASARQVDALQQRTPPRTAFAPNPVEQPWQPTASSARWAAPAPAPSPKPVAHDDDERSAATASEATASEATPSVVAQSSQSSARPAAKEPATTASGSRLSMFLADVSAPAATPAPATAAPFVEPPLRSLNRLSAFLADVPAAKTAAAEPAAAAPAQTNRLSASLAEPATAEATPAQKALSPSASHSLLAAAFSDDGTRATEDDDDDDASEATGTETHASKRSVASSRRSVPSFQKPVDLGLSKSTFGGAGRATAPAAAAPVAAAAEESDESEDDESSSDDETDATSVATSMASSVAKPASTMLLRDRLRASANGAAAAPRAAAPAVPAPVSEAAESEEDESEDESDDATEYTEGGPEWVEGWDANYKHIYYFNINTEETSWKMPAGDYRPMSEKDRALRRKETGAS